MKKIFTRFMLTLGALIVGLLLLFGVSFYQEYMRNRNFIMEQIQSEVDEIGIAVSSRYNSFMEFSRVFSSLLELQYGNNKRQLEEINSIALEELAVYYEIDETLEREELLSQIAKMQTIRDENSILEQLISAYSMGNIKYLTISKALETEALFGKQLSSFHDEASGSILIVDDLEGQRAYRYYFVQPLEIFGAPSGFLLLEILPFEGILSSYSPHLLFIGDNIHISDPYYFKEAELAALQRMERQEVVDFFHSQGYLTFAYETDSEFFQLLYYRSYSFIHEEALRLTFTATQILLILILLMFAFTVYVMHTLFIKPSYQMLMFVHACNERQYALPEKLSAMWRPVFLGIRDAYLINEKLLEETESQSNQLHLAWKKAISANRAKTMFIAKVSHELKTPLNAIRGYAQLLKRNLADSKSQKQLEIIDYSTGLLMNMVEDLLDFSMLEENKVQLERNKLNFADEIERISQLFVDQFERKGIDFSVVLDSGIPDLLWGDKKKIKQILINLLSNALKFTDFGRVSLELRLVEENEETAFVSFKVKDTGKGIAAEKIEAIFEPFNQEDNTISRQYGGTGLGLTISQQLAKQMGGEIKVKSEMGRGAVFEFALPLQKLRD